MCPLPTAVRLALMLHVWAKAENLRYPNLFSKGKNTFLLEFSMKTSIYNNHRFLILLEAKFLMNL